ncbi:MAG: glycosyltransferase [Bacteroidales bacterium]|nr:glycosyltransferase [Bacteroidales bacterium]
MKKVLFVIDSLDCGGAEKSLVSLLPLLDYSSMDVDLMIVKKGGLFEQMIPPQVSTIPVPKVTSWRSRCCHGFLFLETRKQHCLGITRHGAETYWQIMSSVHPAPSKSYDVAIAYQQGFPTYYVAEKVRATKKWAWINTDLTKAGYRPNFNRPFYDRMTGVCTVSDVLPNMLSDAGFVSPKSIRVIKDILNAGLIQKMADMPLESFPLSAPLKFLTVGRLVPPKDYPLAVETASLLQDKGLNFVWTFVGEGAERKNIETLINHKGLKNHIVLAGLQSNPYPFFKACDIYVQTSSFEGFGLTLSEAKILHKPIVTTNFPSAYDQIIDGENGLIAEMTPESVADKILSIIENPALKNRLIENTRKEENRTAEMESEKVNQLLLED